MAWAKGKGKVEKAKVRYQDFPKGTKHCAKCSMFRSPDKCVYVKGKVSPHGYCDAFDLKIAKRS